MYSVYSVYSVYSIYSIQSLINMAQYHREINVYDLTSNVTFYSTLLSRQVSRLLRLEIIKSVQAYRGIRITILFIF